MNIRISRLELTNFKCFRHKELTFDSGVTTIRGRNGVGKTTIADAIIWCLFGKNSAGQTTFDLKTHDEQGNTIPHLDHSVEMQLELWSSAGTMAQGLSVKTVTIRRSLKESWIKKRGATEETLKGHTTEYFIDGESTTAKDFEKYISNLINEDLFRTITYPSYFPSKKWQEQRAFLAGMVGTIAPEEIATTDELADLVKSLSDTPEGVDIIAYRKHLAYQIKKIKDKLEKIPVRLEEQNKALPEKLDWDALQVQYTDVSRQSQEIAEKIIAIKSGNGGDVIRDEIRKEIRFIRTDIEKIEVEQRKLLRIRQDEQDRAIQTARQQFNTLVATQRDLEASLPSFDKLIERCRETLDQCEKDAQEIREDWALNLRRTLNFSDSDCVCPTCGQNLPQEQVMEKRQKAEENLNADKARIKTELTKRAERVKDLRAKAEDEIKNYEAQKAVVAQHITETKEQINTTFAEKQKLEKIGLPTLDTILSNNVQYVALSKQLSEAHAKLDSVSIDEDTTKQLADLEASKAEYSQILSEVQAQLATKAQYDRIQQLIAGVNEEQKSLVTQLSELEKKEDVARDYQDRQNEILEERVNQHFSIVRWKMFRTVVNNGDPFQEPYCECYVNGVAYRDGLNQAARLNAGLDIINTLCRHYQVSAPIVIDNSESNLNILPTASQQIRLQVADTELQTL
jgi:DNA repair exonuclease SbcCD ATPase subunit